MEEAEQGFASLGISDLLELDPRPTFVLNGSLIANGVYRPVFVNGTMRSSSNLMNVIHAFSSVADPWSSSEEPVSRFHVWVGSTSSQVPESFTYSGFIWKRYIVQEVWIVISGSSQPQSDPLSSLVRVQPANPRTTNVRAYSHESTISETTANSLFVTPGTPDWTVAHPSGDLSAHVVFARSIDWAATALGDMSTWTPEFRQIANLLMGNPHPAALFWGSDLTVIYNEAYAENVAGDKHPKLMGAGFTTASAFQEIWDFVSEIFDECQRTGDSVAVTEQMLPIKRHGFHEETFYTWSLTPLYGGTSKILGLYNAPFETTRQTRTVRATQTLIKLAQETALAQTVSEFWPRILKALEDNGFDFPFALIYSVPNDSIPTDESSPVSLENSQDMKTCVLEGTLGVPENHPAAPKRLYLTHAQGGFIPSFRDAMQTRKPKLLTISDNSLSESLLSGIQWRGYGDPCHEALVCPIRPTNGENVMGFLVIGVNPRRRFDEDYQTFIQLLDRQLATSLASVTLFEAEMHRSQVAAEAAAQERSRLSEELYIQRSRLQRMAELSPVGMFSVDIDGDLLEANDRWYEMTGYPRDSHGVMSWMSTFHEISVPIMEMGWQRLIGDRISWSAPLRLKKPWYDPTSGDELDNWVIAEFQPEFSSKSKLKSIMGAITDITLSKFSEEQAQMRAKLSEQLLLREKEAIDLQAKQLKEAEENRASMNNFIDITSHEMRNPLSAILQSADSISTALKEILKGQGPNTTIADTLQGSVESAETILLCARHQKAIVDDILTISKLDSNLLLITPMPEQPVEIVRQALKMFVAECDMNEIDMGFHLDSSWMNMGIQTVMLDSSRLLQVLVNLMTNAIKFTKSEKRKRTISISLSAYVEPPAEGPDNFRYFPTHKARYDVTASEEWGDGQIVYLRFEIKDSGCGLSEEDKVNLFKRFAQASPKTHVKYGGSGLGLFISRQLTELQGGEIGVASDSGVGSTFAFYIKARRAEDLNSKTTKAKINADVQATARVATDVLRDETAPKLISAVSDLSPVSPLSPMPDIDPKHWHVLIVEDNLVNQKVLAQGIRKLGSTVYLANHGGEALDRIKESKYYIGERGAECEAKKLTGTGSELTVVLMDLEMPTMDGLTCVRKIRELEKEGLVEKHLPIIAVTANARGEQVVAAKNSGMDDVMPKPFQIRELVPKIEALLLRDSA
ncbi:hypothetical protein BGZ60DRAFT_370994 [Tricladium varicosporioides]|nr:hypothetical protein BGZ60DRAFT_370994 [Hymenoscyphus varicosporioides]